MSRESSPEIDDELFNEVYGKEYTVPPLPSVGSTVKTNSKRSHIAEEKNGKSDDDEDMALDPNAVPTDFTSRDARVREAKEKAMERIWKKRKDEEFICKLCGEAGHFTQGCPSTLGAKWKLADCFQRVPARDKQVRSLFTDKVICQIEKEVGCKLKMDEKFLIVSGKDGLILSKGLDAVHKLIQDDKNKTFSSSQRPRSRSPANIPRSRSPARAPRTRSPARAPKPRSPAHVSRSKSPIYMQRPIDTHLSRHSESQRSHSTPRNSSRRSLNKDGVVGDQVREDLQTLSTDPLYAYANGGSSGQLTHPKAPSPSNFRPDHNSFDGHNLSLGMAQTDKWNLDRHENKFQSDKRFDYPNPQNLEEVELEFKKEKMELGRIRDQEEDEEKFKHRECIQGLREDNVKKLTTMNNMHMKQWEEFLQFDIQKRHQLAHHNAINQSAYMEYNQTRDPHYMGGTNIPIDSKIQPPYPGEEYSAPRQHDFYRGNVQSQRNDELERTYGRYH